MTRNEAREQAFLLLFSDCFHDSQTTEEMIDTAVQANNYEENDFTQKLIEGVKANEAELNEAIRRHLKKWQFERLPKTTVAILRIAIYEILYFEDVPDAVSVNEAVELAKRFGSEKDYSFINGVLGSIVREKNEADSGN